MARIAAAEEFLLVHVLDEPRGVSCAWYDRRESVLVRLADDDGVAGWGEACVRPGTIAVLRELGAMLVGRDPMAARARIADLQATAADAWALSALSVALDDLRARRLGVSVATLYGGPLRERVRAYASSGGYHREREIEELWPAEAAEMAAAGFTAMKLRIGRHAPGRELPVLEAVRAQQPELELLVDANGAYALPRAIAVGRALERLGFGWYEEPLTRTRGGLSYPGYERLAAALDIPVAAGEALETRGAFAAFLSRGAAEIVQPDVGICGGIGEALLVGELAALDGRLCIPHCWGGAILLAATLQLHALLPAPDELDDPGLPPLELDVFENPLMTRVIAEPFRLEGGHVAIPSGPGLGVDVDEAFVRAAALTSYSS
jgi:D-galactarolactone cycloisomerase